MHYAENVGTLHLRDGVFANEVLGRHDGVGEQGFEVNDANIARMNGRHSSSSDGVDIPDSSDDYEGGDEDGAVDGSQEHVEIVLGARTRKKIGKSVATMFHSPKMRMKAFVGLCLLIFLCIFFSGIDGIVSHNKQVAALNAAISLPLPSEDCPERKKSKSKSSKTNSGSGRHLVSWKGKGKNGEFEEKHVPVHLRMNTVKNADTSKRNLVRTTHH